MAWISACKVPEAVPEDVVTVPVKVFWPENVPVPVIRLNDDCRCSDCCSGEGPCEDKVEAFMYDLDAVYLSDGYAVNRCLSGSSASREDGCVSHWEQEQGYED